MSVRIAGIDRITLNVPFTPRRLWNPLLVWKWGIVELVRVETDTGLVGWDEALLHYGWGGGLTDATIERVSDRPAAEFLGDDSIGAGLQLALYDVVGKALGVPAHALLSGHQVRERVPIAWWNTKMPPAALAAEAIEAVAHGYTTHKYKARPWFDLIDQVEQIAAVTPDSYRLDIDWNQMLHTAGEAAPLLQTLDAYPQTAIFEAPIPQSDYDGYRQLRSKINTPLAVHWNAAQFIPGLDAVDGYVVSGGAEHVLRQGILAAEFNKNFWLQNVGLGLTTAFNAHLGAVLSHARWPAVTALNNYADDLLTDPLSIMDGELTVPTGPGLGVAVDEAAIERFRMEPPYDLPEPRHVLSMVWPSGRVVHYARMQQLWDDHLTNHHLPERGITLEIQREQDSPDPRSWAELYRRALRGPVVDRR